MGEKGLLTIVDEPTINPKHIIDWFIEAQKIMDTKSRSRQLPYGFT